MPAQFVDDVVRRHLHLAHGQRQVPVGFLQDVGVMRPGEHQDAGSCDQEDEHRDDGHGDQHGDDDGPCQPAGERIESRLHTSADGSMEYKHTKKFNSCSSGAACRPGFPVGPVDGPTGQFSRAFLSRRSCIWTYRKGRAAGVNFQGVNFEIIWKNGRLKFENFRKTREKHFEEIAFTWECNLLQSPIFELVVWTW